MIQKLAADQPVDQNWKTINALIDVVNAIGELKIKVHAKAVVGHLEGTQVSVPPCITNGRVDRTEGGLTIVIE